MDEQARRSWHSLQAEVLTRFRKDRPSAPAIWGEFRGQDIVDFQEALSQSVGGRVSEKWVYTHLKQQHDRLPRIDVLDMLSRYAGYEQWREVVQQHESVSPVNKPRRMIRTWGYIGLILCVGLLGGAGALRSMWSSDMLRVCVIDALEQRAIPGESLRVVWLREGQSEQQVLADSGGCVAFVPEGKEVTLVIEAPYYRTDTLRRRWKKRNRGEEQTEIVALQPDPYALMLHYYSQAKVADWQQRRAQLDEMFTEDAQIFQLHPQNRRGMALMTKREFIDRLSLPLTSQGPVHVLSTEYQADRIRRLTFTQSARTP